MAQRPRKSFFGGRGIAQAGGRPWRSKNLQGLVQRSTPVRGRYTEEEILRAVVNAPTTWAAVPTASSPPTVTYSAASNDTPDTTKLGGVAWKRYWFRGNNGQIENTGGGRTLLQRADFESALTQGPALGGGINYNNNSGNSTEWWQNFQGLLRSGQATEDIGDFSTWGWGFTLTGRGFAVNGQGFTDFVVYVEEGGVLKRCPYQSFPRGDAYAYVDFGTSATRNILLVIEPDSWSSEMLIPTTATMVPWSGWRTNKLTYAFLTDSYYQSMNVADGCASIEQVALLTGGHPVPHASSQGGSGYSSDNQDANVRPFQFPHRLNRFSTPQPDAGFIFGGINDGWPTSNIAGGGTSNTAQAIDRTLQTLRFDNPNMLMVVGSPWSPNGPVGQTVGGKYQLLNTYLQTVLAKTPGPWIFIDSLSGSWKTSKGTQRSSAEGPWITGTGNSGAPNGTGNADTYISDDGTHPNDVGRRYLAEKISQYMHEAAASMLPAATINGGAFDLDIFDPDYFEGAYTQRLANITQVATLSGAAAALSLTGAQTLAGVTQSAALAVPGSVAAAQSLAGITQAASLAAPAGLSAAQTLAGVSQAATFTAPASASAAQTLGAVSQTATMTVAAQLSTAQFLAGAIQTATITSAPSLSAAQTLAGVSQVATLQGVPVAVVGAQTLAPVAQVATASVLAKVSGAQTLAGVTQSATLAAPSAVTAAQTLGNVTQAATIAGAPPALTAAQALGGVTQAATLASVSQVQASQTLGPVSQAATLAAQASVQAAQQLQPVVQVATLGSSVAVSAAQTLAGVTQSAALTLPAALSASQTLAPVAQSATLQAVLSGSQVSAAQILGGMAQTATITSSMVLQASQTLAPVAQTAALALLARVTAAQTLAPVAQSGQLAAVPTGVVGAQALQPIAQSAALASSMRVIAAQQLADVIQSATMSVSSALQAAQVLGPVAQVATLVRPGLSSVSAAQALAGIVQTASLRALASLSADQVLGPITQVGLFLPPYVFRESERVFYVPGENRVFLVAGEDRGFRVETEDREFKVQPEDRAFIVN